MHGIVEHLTGDVLGGSGKLGRRDQTEVRRWILRLGSRLPILDIVHLLVSGDINCSLIIVTEELPSPRGGLFVLCHELSLNYSVNTGILPLIFLQEAQSVVFQVPTPHRSNLGPIRYVYTSLVGPFEPIIFFAVIVIFVCAATVIGRRRKSPPTLQCHRQLLLFVHRRMVRQYPPSVIGILLGFIVSVLNLILRIVPCLPNHLVFHVGQFFLPLCTQVVPAQPPRVVSRSLPQIRQLARRIPTPGLILVGQFGRAQQPPAIAIVSLGGRRSIIRVRHRLLGRGAARLIERLPQSLALVLDVGGVDDKVDDRRAALQGVVGRAGGHVLPDALGDLIGRIGGIVVHGQGLLLLLGWRSIGHLVPSLWFQFVLCVQGGVIRPNTGAATASVGLLVRYLAIS